MRVAIVGSREYPRLDLVRAYVHRLALPTVVVSGGACGVDRVAVDRARSRGMETQVFEADWTGLGRRAGFVRNEQMIRTVELVVGFWDEASRGTAHALNFATSIGVEARWYGADGWPRGPWVGS